MPTEQKKQIVSEFETQARECRGLVLTSFKGLKTVEFNELRQKLRPLNSEYRVVKNSLTKLALKAAGFLELAELFDGSTAIIIERGDPIAATKTVFEFARTHENVQIKAGVFDGRVVNAAQLKEISALPTKEVLLSKLLGTLQAPMTNLVSVLQAPMRDLVGVFDAISKKSNDGK